MFGVLPSRGKKTPQPQLLERSFIPKVGFQSWQNLNNHDKKYPKQGSKSKHSSKTWKIKLKLQVKTVALFVSTENICLGAARVYSFSNNCNGFKKYNLYCFDYAVLLYGHASQELLTQFLAQHSRDNWIYCSKTKEETELCTVLYSDKKDCFSILCWLTF